MEIIYYSFEAVKSFFEAHALLCFTVSFSFSAVKFYLAKIREDILTTELKQFEEKLASLEARLSPQKKKARKKKKKRKKQKAA